MLELDKLAEKLGIEAGWWDFFGNWRIVSPETKRVFIRALGFDPDNPDDELARLALKENERILPVFNLGPGLVLNLPPHLWGKKGELRLRNEKGEAKTLEVTLLKDCPLPSLPYGLYDIELRDEKGYLLVAPPAGYIPPSDAKLWGISAQVYALKGKEDKGAGDFTSLKELCALAGNKGWQAVGINPLHALFSSDHQRFSPYSPSSRMFLNVLYIDPEVSPDWEGTQLAAPSKALIDYPLYAQAKFAAFRQIYANFKAQASPQRKADFARFLAEGGEDLRLFSIFEALQEYFLAQGQSSYWREWPLAYQKPNSRAIEEFAVQNPEKVEFFAYLQWQADIQLGETQRICHRRKMAIGLYRDLAVGFPADGVEAWANQDILAEGVGIGAPPDPLNLQGQDWGLSPFRPLGLLAVGLSPLAKLLAANMRHAGALRIDHAMSLKRLYLVPQGAKADQGAYLKYPEKELFALVALQSYRQQCLVVGEDLGTVPDGFRENMQSHGFFSYKILPFERKNDGGFKKLEDYPKLSLSALGTHDMPPFLGYWQGMDIEERETLNLYPRPDMGDEERRERAIFRQNLVGALAEKGLIRWDFPTRPLISAKEADELFQATSKMLQNSASLVSIIQLEDILRLNQQMNLPGTVDQYPNWRKRYPKSLTEIAKSTRFLWITDQIKQ